MNKTILGIIPVISTCVVLPIYIYKMWKGKIRPHPFTWLTWSLTAAISAASRTAADAGPGAWGQWAAVLDCGIIALLALRYGRQKITRSDWLVFFGILSAIPMWMVTHDPLAAAAIVTMIDLAGYYSTFRKSYHQPHHEAIFNYAFANFDYLFAMMATVVYSRTTLLFPATLFAMNTIFIVFVLIRRRQVPVGSYT